MKKFIRRSAAAAMLALAFTACGLSQDAGPVADKLIGSNPDELEKRIVALLEKAGTELGKAEFAEIITSTNRNGISPSYTVTVDIVSPKNPDKLLRVSWYDSERTRNRYTEEELLLTDSDNNVVEGREGFEGMLFPYADAKVYIDNAPRYCTESLEASGYKENGFVERLDIERNPHDGNRLSARMRVGYEGKSTLRKSYAVAPDGGHIVRK